ncbi:MAG: triose-phosphate isomerase [Candidatus Bilamarchaeaceae archaeon]
MIVLNLKNYAETYRRIDLLVDAAREASQETEVRIIICPPATHLQRARMAHKEVFAQHVDAVEPGAYTGYVLPEALKSIGIRGSLINHSERRCPEKVPLTSSLLKKYGLESIVCAESPAECRQFAKFKPDFIAIEPPELIGSGKSVSKTKPKVITDSLDELRKVSKAIPLLCGAGVSDKKDVDKALALGASGVLLASAFVKATDPLKFLLDLAKPFKKYM